MDTEQLYAGKNPIHPKSNYEKDNAAKRILNLETNVEEIKNKVYTAADVGAEPAGSTAAALKEAKDYADNTYVQSTGYTDIKIEDAMKETQSAVEAIDVAIRNKAEKDDIPSIANNLITTEEGKVLDASQGKRLSDMVTKVSEHTRYIEVTTPVNAVMLCRFTRNGALPQVRMSFILRTREFPEGVMLTTTVGGNEVMTASVYMYPPKYVANSIAIYENDSSPDILELWYVRTDNYDSDNGTPGILKMDDVIFNASGVNLEWGNGTQTILPTTKKSWITKDTKVSYKTLMVNIHSSPTKLPTAYGEMMYVNIEYTVGDDDWYIKKVIVPIPTAAVQFETRFGAILFGTTPSVMSTLYIIVNPNMETISYEMVTEHPAIHIDTISVMIS